MTTPGIPETPIEREDGPEVSDVPQADPAGRVDDEDLDPVADPSESQPSAMDTDNKTF